MCNNMNVEEAKKILADAESENMKEAFKEFNEFIEQWGNKYGVKLNTAGDFSGQILNTRIEIIKKT